MDGRLWWLRWFDRPAWYGGPTATATVTAALSRLPRAVRADSLPPLDAALAASAAPQAAVDVHAGLIPALAIGTVYRDGCPVGRLEAEKKRFKFERTRCVAEVVTLHGTDAPMPLFGREADRPEHAISPEAYALKGFDDSLCVRIRPSQGSGEQLVIPCCEAFRTLLAPHRMIALALTNGPWEDTRSKVVHMTREDPEDEPTRERDDGSWHVALAGGVGPAFAVLLGHLVLHPAGRRAANSVWASVMEQPGPSRGRPGAARTRSLRSGRLRATFPFDWDVLRIEVHGFCPAPETGAWVGLQIVSVAWPPPSLGPPRKVWWTPWKDPTPGKTRTPVDEPRPYGGVRETAGEDGEVDGAGGRLTKEVDPSVGSQVVPVEAAGPLWRNSPWLRRKPKARSRIYLGQAKRYRRQETSAASAGNAVPGPTGAVTAQAKAKPRKPGSTRFAEILHMFARLHRDMLIEAFGFVQPSPEETEYRGDVAAWKFPCPPRGRGRPSRWHLLEPEMEVTRAALVCAVRCEGSVVHWIEIELRPKEHGYRSLLFTTDGLPVAEVVRNLLRIAVSGKGVWPNPAELVAEVGVQNAVGWTHSQTDGELNGERALDAMRATLEGSEEDGDTIPA